MPALCAELAAAGGAGAELYLEVCLHTAHNMYSRATPVPLSTFDAIMIHAGAWLHLEVARQLFASLRLFSFTQVGGWLLL